MRGSLSPILRELENLEKDADSRKLAMKALKSYVKDLDSKAIPMFLAKVSESKQTGASSGDYTISLYEVLARVHGPKIVPQIGNIMTTIIKTLSSSAGSFALHQACSKVVPAIARYAIDSTTAEDKKRCIVHSLCKPLSDCLLGSLENLSSGAALCLQMLIESDNWRFASNEMVNEVCQRVAGALEKHSQTNSHMALVMTLAKHNSLIVEAYSRLLLQSGVRILELGFAEENSQKQLSAIHMMSSLMRCLDLKSISFGLEFVIKELEKCQSDRMPFVTGAAFEALQLAKKICAEKGASKSERVTGSITGSNFDGRQNTRRRNVCGSRVQSPRTVSPESQSINSFVGYDYFTGSPISLKQDPRGMTDDSRSVNRKLWRRCDNGVLDISLKDGIFSSLTGEVDILKPNNDEFSDNCSGHTENFAGFLQGSTRCAAVRSTTSSPQRSNSTINLNDVKIFSTPRKLIRSLQDPDNSCFAKNQTGRFKISTPITFDQMTASKLNDLSPGRKYMINSEGKLSSSGEQFICSSESVSSTEDAYPDVDTPVSVNMIPRNEMQIEDADVRKGLQFSAGRIVFAIFIVLFAVVFRLSVTGDPADRNIPVPT
ncbi:hypothetical protein F511_07597 [Dorcoceras hygrometricum]|uniref:TORTIFOLIA1/SINE1-2 N-terminal domain-containing protein n=1 Tax=Dorcoceras hygrometricum TaxID=472368 RepID=A0A2Z7D1Q8_9LAMI|nr:hypothetical protein F511_07597 [Dorcoceras hygrometricum]